jgi:hypothetical protein
VGYAFAGYEGVERPGISVEESAILLRRWGYLALALARRLGAKMTSLPEMEVKYGLGRHIWEDARLAQAIDARRNELRSNASLLTAAPDDDLEVVLDETLWAPDTASFLAAVYGVWKPALTAAFREYLARANPLAEAATERLMRHALADLDAQIAWGRAALEAVCAAGADRAAADRYAVAIAGLLERAGGIVGPEEKRGHGIERVRSATPFQPPETPERERKYGIICELPREYEEGEDYLIRMMRRRMNEIDVAELCATTLWDAEGKPLEYYVDLARHCFDECRHAMFGHAALNAEGIAADHFPLKRGNAIFFQKEAPMDRYIHLGVVIEQKKMKKTGKKAEWLYCRDEAQHPLMATFQDFDWADEVYHVQMSRRWVKEFFDRDWQRVEERASEIEARWASAVNLWDREKAAC